MTAVLLWYTLGLLAVPPSPVHSLHVPSYGAKCEVVAKARSSNGLLTVKAKVCK